MTVDPGIDGPLERAQALALVDRGDELLDAGDLEEALRHFQRVVGHRDADVTAAALLGIATVYFRADQEEAAVATWKSILELPETPGTYLALRQLAASHVRAGHLDAAIDAYRQAERRAPAQDRAEIASRLGWLLKETGDARGSRRSFSRSRDGGPGRPAVTTAIIVLTSLISVAASLPDTSWLFDALQLDKAAVAAGEYWRLATCMLLHAPVFLNPLHLLFNMYALSFAGGLVERMYGGRTMLALYLLTGIAASTASFAFGGDVPSVGASGAIFGAFGILLAADRIHHPVVDRQSRAILGQIGVLIALNLVLGFAIPRVDYLAHIGGLLAGLWLGAVLVPGKVPTLASFWQRPGDTGPAGTRATTGAGATVAAATAAAAAATVGGAAGTRAPSGAARLLGIAALLAVIVAGLAIGTGARGASGGVPPASGTAATVEMPRALLGPGAGGPPGA